MLRSPHSGSALWNSILPPSGRSSYINYLHCRFLFLKKQKQNLTLQTHIFQNPMGLKDSVPEPQTVRTLKSRSVGLRPIQQESHTCSSENYSWLQVRDLGSLQTVQTTNLRAGKAEVYGMNSQPNFGLAGSFTPKCQLFKSNLTACHCSQAKKPVLSGPALDRPVCLSDQHHLHMGLFVFLLL